MRGRRLVLNNVINHPRPQKRSPDPFLRPSTDPECVAKDSVKFSSAEEVLGMFPWIPECPVCFVGPRPPRRPEVEDKSDTAISTRAVNIFLLNLLSVTFFLSLSYLPSAFSISFSLSDPKAQDTTNSILA